MEDSITDTNGLTLVRNVSPNGIARFYFVPSSRERQRITVAPYARGQGVGSAQSRYVGGSERQSYLLDHSNGQPHLVFRSE